jgi:hypothetical protein
MSEKISPQGYNYGSQPFQKTPFWGGSDGEPSEYVKNISEEKTETEEKTTYKISYTDQDNNTVSLDAIEVPKKSESSTVSVKDVSMATDGNTTTFSQTKTDGTEEIIGNITVPETPDVSDDIVEISRNILETSTEKTVNDTYKTKGGTLVALKSIVIPIVEKITDYIQNVDASITNSGVMQILRLKKTKGGAEEGEYCNFETVQPSNTVTDVGITPYTKTHWKQRVIMLTKGNETASTIGSFNDYFESDIVNDVSMTSEENDEKTTYTINKKMCDDVITEIGTIEVPKSSGGGSSVSLEQSSSLDDVYVNTIKIDDNTYFIGSSSMFYAWSQNYYHKYQITREGKMLSTGTVTLPGSSESTPIGVFQNLREFTAADNVLKTVTLGTELNCFFSNTAVSWTTGNLTIKIGVLTTEGRFDYDCTMNSWAPDSTDINYSRGSHVTFDVTDGNYTGIICNIFVTDYGNGCIYYKRG